ncbi:MAG: VCBS repeat-containing protein, partial [Planctomycetes bacterium]|nr:VCBS repeat-containing protein [Planctomycetota bacterium]
MSHISRPACSLALLGLLLGACGGSDTKAGEVDPAVILARDRAADYGARGDKWQKANAALAPLLAKKDVPLEDLLRAANANLADTDTPGDPVERARPFIERAEKLAPEDPVLLWCRYHVAASQYDLPAAVSILRKLAALRPDDFTVGLALAQTLDDMDEPESEKEAQAMYRELVAIPAEYTGAWRITMLYRLMQQLNREGKEKEAEPLYDELKSLEARGIQSPKDAFHSPGTLGVLPPHTVTVFERAAPKPARVTLERRALDVAGARGAFRVDLGWNDATRDFAPSDEETFATHATSSIVAFGTNGLTLTDARGAARSLLAQPVLDAVAFDRRNHGVDKATDPVASRKLGDRDMDLLLLTEQGEGSALLLLDHDGESWKPEPLASLPKVSGPGSLLPVDYDHDGDVDLFVSTVQGLRVLRNDGLDGTGSFADASGELSLPAGDFRAQSEDFERDNDVDFLFVPRAGGAPRLSSNERVGGVGRFKDVSATLPPGLGGRWLVPADFDGDSWVDLAVFGGDLALYTRTELGGWRAEVKHLPLAHAPTGEPVAVDWDLDGTFDLLWPCAEAPATVLFAPGFEAGGLSEFVGEPFSAPVAGPSSLEVADLDGDLDLDLLRLDPTGLAVYLSQGAPTGTWLALQGHKDNARGLGSVVELRSGLLYRRIYYRGKPELVGFGGQALDVVRVTWPNGVVQGNFGLAAGSRTIVAQRLGQVGSCPFLYTWNGKTYEFISDVLGITPLGLPMGPDMLVPPDHDEYVLVKGEQLVPKDGVYEMHLTEELREVTYLDRIRL